MGTTLIELSNVDVKYKNEVVLESVSLSIDTGKFYVLVGENGAGKSTLLKVMMGLKNHINGTIRRNFSQFGYLPEKVDLPSYIKASEFLNDMILLKNTKTKFNITTELKYFDLKNIRYNSMSKGMKQKLAIIQSYIADQELIILDEPLNGLDHNSKELLVDKMEQLVKNGKTIIIVTHFFEIFSKLNPKLIKIEHKSVLM